LCSRTWKAEGKKAGNKEGREEKNLFLSILGNQGKVVSPIKLLTTVPPDNLNCKLA
jgi:hypothetical protein